MRNTIRLYDVFNGDHIERDDEVLTLIGPKEFDDNRGAREALGDYLWDAREGTNRRSREAGAEDRDHLLACCLTTLAQSLPGFNGMSSDEAREVIVPVIHGWLNQEPWLPYTAGLLPPGATFKLHPDDLTTLTYDPDADFHKQGFCSDDEVYVQGDPWEGKDRGEETPAPAVGIDREPGLDRSWGRLPVTVASGGGACGETIRMVYEGLCGLTALIEWSEGDRVVRHPVLIETFVQLDDLSPVLVGEMLHEDYEPTGTKVFLRFSAIRSVEVS